MPRRTEEIGRLGESITRSQLEPGDLVFFNTLARAYSHVAIYIGDGRFLHAPARGGRVRIEALDDRYWRARFDGARRFIEADGRALRADRAWLYCGPFLAQILARRRLRGDKALI